MKKAVICDLDKTLALFTHRGPFETEKCIDDCVNEPVREVVSLFYNNDYDIIIVSGRNQKYKDLSVQWLENNNIPFTDIFLRKDDDNRPDQIIKEEIYIENIKNKWNILFVLDDRDKVVDMWRNKLKLTCLQVNYGDF